MAEKHGVLKRVKFSSKIARAPPKKSVVRRAERGETVTVF